MFFSTNIKLLRNRKGISQEEVANTLGIKRTSLTGYEKGNSAPALKGLIGFSDYYKVSLDLLLKVDLQTYSESKLSQLDRRELDVQGSRLRVLATTIGDDNEENIELVPKKAKAFQLLMYAYLYLKMNPEYLDKDVIAGNFSFKNLRPGLIKVSRKINKKNCFVLFSPFFL